MVVKAKKKLNGHLFRQNSDYLSFYTNYKDMVWAKIRRFRLEDSIYVGFKLMQSLKVQNG